MKKSKTNAAQGELAKSQLEAPVRLTPEQLEDVVAGVMKQISTDVKGGTGGTTTTGAVGPRVPVLKLF